MAYSYDQQNWLFFDNNIRNSGAGTFTFWDTTPFSQSQIYVAYGLPYSYQRIVDHTAQMTASPWVSPTASGNSSLVIGQSPGGIDDLGRVVAPRNIFGYQITDTSSTFPKKKIVLTSGIHANETLGNHTLEGLVDFLNSDDLEASILRKYADIYVYPMANPDGRFAGYNRGTVEKVTFDSNRHWESPNYDGQSDIQVVGEAMIADTGADVDYFIDFHSTVAGKTNHFGWVDMDPPNEFHLDPFWQNLLVLEPTLGTRDSSMVNLTAQKFGLDALSANFTTTFETQFIPGENIDRFQTLGRNFGVAFEQAVSTFADLNFDSELDTQDWLLFVAGAETDLSALTPIEAYEQGDLDGDGVNSGLDFGLFKQAFETANGTGSFALMLTEVPEPSIGYLTMLGIFFFSAAIRNRPRRNS
jgi:hypothetical protein